MEVIQAMNNCWKCNHFRPGDERFKERDRCFQAVYKPVRWQDPDNCPEFSSEARTDYSTQFDDVDDYGVGDE